MSKKKKLIPIAIGVVVAGVYSIFKGKGIFNKTRFSKQHDAVSRYLQSRYPNAEYTPIQASGEGWSTVIKNADGRKCLLYMTYNSNGVFIFNEHEI